MIKIELSLNGGAFVDYSDSVVLDKLDIEKSLDANNEQRRNIGGSITATGDAYTLLYFSLFFSPNRYSSEVRCRITLEDCSSREYYFTIDSSSLDFCDNQGCIMQFTLIEENELLDCVDNFLISDDWQGWFNDDTDASSPTRYPRYRYCDVTRPYALMAYILIMFQFVDFAINIWNTIFGLIFSIIPGTPPSIPTISSLVLGCNRVHPAPFIRTYTDNVCDYCTNIGSPIVSDATTNPIFYDISSRYYNLTHLFAPFRKGFRVAGTLPTIGETEHFIVDNKSTWTLRNLYRQLSEVFNGRYFIHNNKFFFDRKDLIGTRIWGASPTVDLTGDDAEYLDETVCYSYNGEPKLRRLYVKYSQDGTDREGDLAGARFSNESFDATSPNYKGFLERQFNFSPQIYTYDGIDTVYDSLYHALAINKNSPDYEGVLKLSSDITRLGKLIVWDGDSPTIGVAKSIGALYSSFNLSEWQNDDGTVWYPPPNFFGIWSSILSPVTFNARNYPMFTSEVQNSLYPNLWEFHKIDMPDPDKKTNISFTFKLNLCCNYFDLDMYQKVQLDASNVGEINYVKISLLDNSVEVKGNLIS